jgi:hypothetical protein
MAQVSPDERLKMLEGDNKRKIQELTKRFRYNNKKILAKAP